MKSPPGNCTDHRYDNNMTIKQTSKTLASIKFIYSNKRFDGQLTRLR